MNKQEMQERIKFLEKNYQEAVDALRAALAGMDAMTFCMKVKLLQLKKEGRTVFAWSEIMKMVEEDEAMTKKLRDLWNGKETDENNKKQD